MRSCPERSNRVEGSHSWMLEHRCVVSHVVTLADNGRSYKIRIGDEKQLGRLKEKKGGWVKPGHAWLCFTWGAGMDFVSVSWIENTGPERCHQWVNYLSSRGHQRPHKYPVSHGHGSSWFYYHSPAPYSYLNLSACLMDWCLLSIYIYYRTYTLNTFYTFHLHHCLTCLWWHSWTFTTCSVNTPDVWLLS